MLGGLVLLMLASGRNPADQATLPFVPLPPATSSQPDVAGQPPAVSATPSPVVMSATQSKPKVVIPDAPVVTTTLPDPPDPVTPVPPPTPTSAFRTTITLQPGGCDHCGGGRH